MTLPLFPDDVEQFPTIAMRRGDTVVRQCNYCGLLVCAKTAGKLGPCPACSTTGWSTQPVAVGPFRPAGHPDLRKYDQ